MRIAYLNPCGRLGGAETSLREVLASVRSAAPDWELWLVLGEDGPLANIGRNLGLRVVLIPFPPVLGQLGDAGRSAAPWAVLRAAGASVAYARRLARLLRQ